MSLAKWNFLFGVFISTSSSEGLLKKIDSRDGFFETQRSLQVFYASELMVFKMLWVDGWKNQIQNFVCFQEMTY